MKNEKKLTSVRLVLGHLASYGVELVAVAEPLHGFFAFGELFTLVWVRSCWEIYGR